MPKEYFVQVEIKVGKDIYVEAENEADARKKAMAELSDFEDTLHDLFEHSNEGEFIFSDSVKITGAEEA